MAQELGRINVTLELVEKEADACKAALALLRQVGAAEPVRGKYFCLRTRSGGEVHIHLHRADIMKFKIAAVLDQSFTHVYSTARQGGPELHRRLTQLAAGAKLIMLDDMWGGAGVPVPLQRSSVRTVGRTGFQLCAGRMPSAAERKVAVGMTVRAKFAMGCRGSGSLKGAWLEARVVRVYRDGSVRVRYVDERFGVECVLSQHWKVP